MKKKYNKSISTLNMCSFRNIRCFKHLKIMYCFLFRTLLKREKIICHVTTT